MFTIIEGLFLYPKTTIAILLGALIIGIGLSFFIKPQEPTPEEKAKYKARQERVEGGKTIIRKVDEALRWIGQKEKEQCQK